MTRPPLVAVVGTGTGVGKTFLSCSLLRHAAARGLRVAGRKPIESGVTLGSVTDAALLTEAGGAEVGEPPYVFPDPVSPHLAARRAGQEIDLDRVTRWAGRGGEVDLIVVETAGGLLSPLSRQATNLDLTRSLDPDGIVLVAPDWLGVLHEVGSARVALEGAGLWARTATVLAAPALPDLTTGGNAAELRWLGWTLDAVSWPRGGDPLCVESLWTALAARSARFT